MAKVDFKEYICRPFCSFFREGEKEELACGGALTAERLVAAGAVGPFSPATGRERDPRLWSEDDPLLDARVCGPCPFRADGCDFRAPDRTGDAEPCGGYILLLLLRKEGRLPDGALEGACRAPA